MNDVSFVGVVRLNEAGEMVCFCYQKDVQAGLCDCKERFDCPEALIEISVIAGTRPSETVETAMGQAEKALSKATQEAEKGAESIKKGLAQLEKSIRQNSRFKI
jgi:nucleoid-associated protein YgaU